MMKRIFGMGLALAASAAFAGCGSSGGSCGGVLYAAQGSGGQRGNLYIVDPETGDSDVVGEIGYAIAALTVGPDCTLYGFTSDDDDDGRRVIVIDTETGDGTSLGVPEDEDGNDGWDIAGAAFINGTLYGFVSASDALGDDIENRLITVDLETGLVELVGEGNDDLGSYEGNGVAQAPDGTVWATSYDSDNILGTMNVSTGVFTKTDDLTLNSDTGDSLKGIAFIGDTLYGVEKNRSGENMPATLVTVDTATGETTPVGELPDGTQGLVYAK